jgi:predicted ATPase
MAVIAHHLARALGRTSVSAHGGAMALLPHRPVLSPVLVGRDAHLEVLERALHQAAEGNGQVVLLAGEAGIGKSRLVRETRARAAEQGFVTLEGACFEPDSGLPYAPVVDLLRTHLAGQPAEAIARALGPAAAELAMLLPELAAGLTGGAPPVPEQDRRRLFHALAQALAGLAAGRPLVVVAEDLHWSDESTLDFLLHLGRRVRGQPMLLLLTYRTDEPDARLSGFLAQIDRERLATELALNRLGAAEVEAMLRAMFSLGRPARIDFLAETYALTEGNPFFIEELLTALVASGDIAYAEGRWQRKPMDELRIPRSVRDAVQWRAARLSEPARQTLAVAAVADRRFDLALLQALTGRGEPELVQSMKELIGAHLVVETATDQFSFRHALTQQALYTELLGRERKSLHRQVAEALEQVYADARDAHVEELAYHAYQAGLWERALRYAQRAGERAQAVCAPRAAAAHFSRALEAAQHLGITPPAELQRARDLAATTSAELDRTRGPAGG